jgi:RNA-binding protein 39
MLMIFSRYKRQDDAKMALEQMEGFELAGRQLRVNTVHEKGTGVRYSNVAESLDDAGGTSILSMFGYDLLTTCYRR